MSDLHIEPHALTLPSIEEANIKKGDHILIRSSLNITKGSQERVAQSAKTIQYCKNKLARVTVIAHRGEGTMEEISDVLKHYVSHTYIPDIIGLDAQNARDNLKDGEVLLLENVRKDVREKQNDMQFAKELLHNASLFVYDGFEVGHRNHASTSAILSCAPQIYFGISFIEEVKHLKHLFTKKYPSLAILGGAKIETKIPLLRSVLKTYDIVAVGGVLANTLLKAKGVDIGDSLVEETSDNLVDIVKHPSLLLPKRACIKTPTKNEYREVIDLKKGESIRDVYIEKEIESALEMLDMDTSSKKHKNFRQVIWNGPLGDSSNGFKEGSEKLASFLSKQEGVVVGGGDVLSSIPDKTKKTYSFISTGGGSFLHYLTHQTLPVIEQYQNTL